MMYSIISIVFIISLFYCFFFLLFLFSNVSYFIVSFSIVWELLTYFILFDCYCWKSLFVWLENHSSFSVRLQLLRHRLWSSDWELCLVFCDEFEMHCCYLFFKKFVDRKDLEVLFSRLRFGVLFFLGAKVFPHFNFWFVAIESGGF